MYEMFGYSGFRTLDISSFDTSKVTDMSYMFICGPETIYVGPDWTTELAVGSSMFDIWHTAIYRIIRLIRHTSTKIILNKFTAEP